MQTLQKNGIDVNNYITRVIPVAGDIIKENLGIEEDMYRSIASNVGIIIHNAARVNHVYEYVQLREENVLSLDEIFKLATNGKCKSIHFISSIITAYSLPGRIDGDGNFTEELHRSVPLSVNNGYCLSKICAEVKISNAITNGFNVNVYRPCQIIQTIYNNKNDVLRDEFLSFFTGCLQLGAFPKIDSQVNCLNVDVVAQAIVYIALNSKQSGKVYNIVNSNHIHMWKLLLKFPKMFFVKTVSIQDFIANYVPKIDKSNGLNMFKSNLTVDGLLGMLSQENGFKITALNTIGASDGKRDILNFSEERFAMKLKQIQDIFKNAQ